jgi:hypothetical protein
MSAYVVDDKTIHRIISFLNTNEARDWVDKSLPLDLRSDREKLGVEMFKMNVAAIRYRYPDNKVKYVFKFKDISAPDRIQALKSLKCFLYQCYEGKIPNRKLYKQLENISCSLQYHIIRNLPEYENAQWG